jgi:hypothetical protein
MFKYILEGNNINWMAIFALVTFFFVFLVSTLVILGRNKTFTDKMAHLPLEDAKPVKPE